MLSLTLVAACSNDSANARAASAGPGGAPAIGRASQVITLAQSDVDTVRRASLADGVPVTGVLHPIETVDVRARIEGDVNGVFVREGQYVHSGQLLASFEALEQVSASKSAEADRIAAQAELSTAQWNLQQTQELFKAGAVPERDVRAATQAVAAASAKVAAAESRIRSTGSSTRDTRVVAPTSGTIEKRFVERGEHLARGAEMFTLVRNDVLELEAAVPERQANKVVVGQPVQFSANGQAFQGRVARVSSTIDPTSRAITVYVQIPNAAGALKGGTFATGMVIARTISNALVVPGEAVRQSAANKSLVYRITDKQLEEVPVQIGVRNDQTNVVQVISGLNEGDVIVSGNVGTLGNGMKIEIAGAAEREGKSAGAKNNKAGAGNVSR